MHQNKRLKTCPEHTVIPLARPLSPVAGYRQNHGEIPDDECPSLLQLAAAAAASAAGGTAYPGTDLPSIPQFLQPVPCAGDPTTRMSF